jgi:hypothetical protein
MFERNIEETINRFRQETIADAVSITSRQILASSMPLALKRMFEVDIDALMQTERERLLNSPHFRYDEEEVLSLFERISEKAQDYAVFTADEYAAALEKNVKLLFNYVCRPQWTLTKYLFADREHAAVDEILEALRAFWHYEYFQIILREYFEQKKISVINAKKFTDLVERIDQEVVRSFDSRKTAHLTEPIFELFNLGIVADTQTAPIEALSIFYDDKNLGSIVERLDQEKATHERLSLHDLVVLISEADFGLGMDISNIVNERLNDAGGMKPERKVTAGQDFEVPALEEYVQAGVHHGDLGHENDALDFIISEEEQGVIMQEHDNIMTPLTDETSDEVDIEDLILSDEVEEEITATDVYELGDVPEPEILEETVPEAIEGDDELDDDENVLSFTDEGILNLEEAMDNAATAYSNEERETMMLTPDDELPDIVLGEGDDRPTPQYLQSKDVIPDISLDEIDSLDLDNEVAEMGSYERVTAFDPYLTSPVDIDIPDADMLLDDNAAAADDKGKDADDDIDWEKEAENLEDIDLGSIEAEEEKLSDSLQRSDDPFKQQNELQPAEELLRQLDLDEFETAPKPAQKRQDDIPVFDEDLPVRAPRAAQSGGEDDEEHPVVPSEEIIREFGDLNQLLPEGDKKKYIKKLFQRNDEAFARALQVLNGKSSWRQASEYIDDLFIKFDVDMYSRLAVKFTDDIYKRYAIKK